jgi:hypothetical protein
MGRQQLCACVLGCLATSYQNAAPFDHLRTTNARIVEVIQFGFERSARFRSLVAAIEASSRAVYLDEGVCGHHAFASCLHVQDGGDIRIRVASREPQPAVVRQIAHELQHAVEIVGDPEATSEQRVAALYRRIGYRSCPPDQDCYETRAAEEIAARVQQEVSSPRQAMSPAHFGTWILDVEQSSFDSCRPRSGRRFDAPRGHGLASSVVEIVDCDGVKHRDAFVFKTDGRDYAITPPGAEPARTIAAAVGPGETVEFAIKEAEAAIACGRRSVSPDGNLMTIETWTVQPDGASQRTREVWRKSR